MNNSNGRCAVCMLSLAVSWLAAFPAPAGAADERHWRRQFADGRSLLVVAAVHLSNPSEAKAQAAMRTLASSAAVDAEHLAAAPPHVGLRADVLQVPPEDLGALAGMSLMLFHVPGAGEGDVSRALFLRADARTVYVLDDLLSVRVLDMDTFRREYTGTTLQLTSLTDPRPLFPSVMAIATGGGFLTTVAAGWWICRATSNKVTP